MKRWWYNLSENPHNTEELHSPGRLLIPSLVSSRFATQPPEILIGLLLIDIGHAFGRSVGVMGQIQTVAQAVSAIAALFMSILSVRFRHKSLLMIGLFFIIISALGCSFALNFTMLFISYALSGLGRAMAVPMAVTLVGIYLPLKKRGNAIGWLLTGVALAGLIGAPVIGVIAEVGGWRWAFLGFVLPIAILSFLLVAKGVPSPARGHHISKSKEQYLEGLKGVFSNRSAMACLLGGVFGMAARQAIVLYGVSFFRQQFRITIEFATILILIWSLCFIIGSLIGGRMINWLGRKPVTILAAFLSGIFIITFTNVPDLWLALILMFLGSVFTNMRATAINSLTLEQVPSFRGTMMSILAASAGMGAALGAGVGGLALLLFNYKVLGLILGVMSITTGLINYFWVIDPTRM